MNPIGERLFQLLLTILHQILTGSVIFEPSKIRTNIAIMIRNFEQCLGFFKQLTSDLILTRPIVPLLVNKVKA